MPARSGAVRTRWVEPRRQSLLQAPRSAYAKHNCVAEPSAVGNGRALACWVRVRRAVLPRWKLATKSESGEVLVTGVLSGRGGGAAELAGAPAGGTGAAGGRTGGGAGVAK